MIEKTIKFNSWFNSPIIIESRVYYQIGQTNNQIIRQDTKTNNNNNILLTSSLVSSKFTENKQTNRFNAALFFCFVIAFTYFEINKEQQERKKETTQHTRNGGGNRKRVGFRKISTNSNTINWRYFNAQRHGCLLDRIHRRLSQIFLVIVIETICFFKST